MGDGSMGDGSMGGGSMGGGSFMVLRIATGAPALAPVPEFRFSYDPRMPPSGPPSGRATAVPPAPGAHHGPRPSNRVRDRLDAGGVVHVLASHAMSPDLVDLLGQSHADGVWLEAEHGPATWDRLADLSRAAELWGLGALLRIPAFAPWRVARALSLGAHGVVLPQVSSVAEATEFARSARFSPLGDRGVTRGRRAYGRQHFFVEEAASPVTVVQVEHADVLDAIPELCAVAGLDVVFIAPNDLADSMGHLGEPDHPDVVAALEDGLRSIVAAAGPAAGTLATPARLPRLVELGVRFCYHSIDPWILARAEQLLDRGGDR
jgi:4-hydroxy-2-oxoheptanedioate aldolase